MITEFIKKFEDGKDKLKEQFSKKHPTSYREIVKSVIELINPDREKSADLPDPDQIHEIDDGDYQGTLLYVIPEKTYQPSKYWVVYVGYGSCSGCDTLQGIRCDNYHDDEVTTGQVEDYMMLALHVVQGLKEI
jgi:hypothetical protein